MKPFEFIKAASTEEAVAALAEHGPEADNTELIKFLAKWVGGTLPGILD